MALLRFLSMRSRDNDEQSKSAVTLFAWRLVSYIEYITVCEKGNLKYFTMMSSRIGLLVGTRSSHYPLVSFTRIKAHAVHQFKSQSSDHLMSTNEVFPICWLHSNTGSLHFIDRKQDSTKATACHFDFVFNVTNHFPSQKQF